MRNYTLLKAGGGVGALALVLSVFFSAGGSAAPKTDRETKVKPLVGTYTAAVMEKRCDQLGGTFVEYNGSFGCGRQTSCNHKARHCTYNIVSCTPNGRCIGETDVKHGWKDDPKGKAVDKPIDSAALKKAIQESNGKPVGPGTVKLGTVLPQSGTTPPPAPKPNVPPATVSTGTFSGVQTGTNSTPAPKPSVPASVWTPGVKTASPTKLPDIYSPKPPLRQYP
jgi:hypothetical protein